MDISVVMPVLNERKNLEELIPRLDIVLSSLKLKYEVIVCSGEKNECNNIKMNGGALIEVKGNKTFGDALKKGISLARGNYIVSMDADLSHEPEVIAQMWRARNEAELVVASRYLKSSYYQTTTVRKFLSIILNRFFQFALSTPIRDTSSGFRMYKAEIIKEIILRAEYFNIQQEAFYKVYCRGARVMEIPFSYKMRKHGASHASPIRFSVPYLLTYFELLKLKKVSGK